MKIGVVVDMNEGIKEKFKQLTELGFNSCQLVSWAPWRFNDEWAELVNSAKNEYNIEITAFWCGYSGPVVWNFYEGQATLGLVPPEYRSVRYEDLIKGSDFAKKLGVKNVVTHVGYIPENPMSTEYNYLIATLKSLVSYIKGNEQNFLFETGQETPVTLRRAIEDIGMDNVGINLDPANLICYGKANPVDALEVFGEYVMGIHAKDAMYPTAGRKLGKQTRLGEGKVNFPAFINKLKEVGYTGPITIEREISGEEQIRDIVDAKKMLEELF